jgi:hypothetical protein
MHTQPSTNSFKPQPKTKTISNPRGAGAPIKYQSDDERKEARRIKHNKTNKLAKAKQRLKAKAMEKLNDEQDIYKHGLTSLFARYRFNYFFTGTYSESYIQKSVRIKKNKGILDLNSEHNSALTVTNRKRVSLKALAGYTQKFVEFLTKTKAINKAFAVFERNKNNEWHTHILLDVNPFIFDVDNYFDRCWKLGINLTLPVETEQAKTKVIQYMVKDILINSKKKYHADTVLSWMFSGINDLTMIDDDLTFEEKQELRDVLQLNNIETLDKVA